MRDNPLVLIGLTAWSAGVHRDGHGRPGHAMDPTTDRRCPDGGASGGAGPGESNRGARESREGEAENPCSARRREPVAETRPRVGGRATRPPRRRTPLVLSPALCVVISMCQKWAGTERPPVKPVEDTLQVACPGLSANLLLIRQ